ncbi:MAG: SusC/RagA family TonB-linked outer membrane protein, partial [Mucilaginibacter sp.]|uniref:SusC/RagA family TonB-linked outer membrane protein n=1 Tax=Mucilaginibacter sp. TaxID=1882438 RepID=UPI00326687BA
LCLKFTSKAQANTKLTGRITDMSGAKPLSGATVKIKPYGPQTKTNENGEFMISTTASTGKLIISYIGYQTAEISFNQKNKVSLQVRLSRNTGALQEINIVSTGYQTLPKERATGSFVQIDNKLINRSISTNIVDRLDGITSGLIFNKNINISNSSNPSTLSIRGRSTIYANPNPLVVVDNFPYNGDLSAINPNDIASITVLKDAAAASIWGAFSGNGVIVITTKKGKYNQAAKIEINSSVTIGEKPNLWYAPQLSSAHFIDVEQYLFNKGYYNASITSTSHPVLSPVVEILLKRRSNLISSTDSAKLINPYTGQDTRDDISKYLYRSSINQQYDLNISGGGENNLYYVSAGFNKDLTSLQRNDFNRISINGSNTYTFLKKKLELTNAVYFTKNTTDNNGISGIGVNYPYLKLKDENGTNLSIPYSYRKPYVDTLGHGNLLDWNYRPLDELNTDNNITKLTEYRVNTLLRYHVSPGLDASVQYQYDQGNSFQNILYGSASYYARDYINQFTQYNPSTGIYTRPVPPGGILDKTIQIFSSQNVRGQINYTHQWNDLHSLSALGGYEIRDINTDYATNRLYGYSDLGSSSAIDYTTNYTLTPTNGTSKIDPRASQLATTNRFKSYFANMAYTFRDRYILSASGRKDESNLFGVSTNQKGIPLWSVGGSWEVSKETFYHLNWLPYVRLRITSGYQGNVDNTLSSLVTATVGSANYYNVPYSSLNNPPNAELRWEKIRNLNFGLDLSSKNNRITGSIEYWRKTGADLIGTSNVDPTTGVTTFKGNSANMASKGIDVVFNSRNIDGVFRWNTAFLVSYAKDQVTKYLLKPTNLRSAITTGISPIEGNPLYSLYSLNWAGLDALGNPQIMLDNTVSKNYTAIFNSTNLANLKYEGPVNPPVYGSLRNDFSLKQFTISLNITYKFGYYFRRPGISYSDLFTGSINFPDGEYVNRWQKPGDEIKTDIPSLIYPANSNRDLVYRYSSVLIEKGDHIRLRDISLSYDISKHQFPHLPFTNVRIYAYINNIGILWKANKAGLDPDNVPNGSAIYPSPKTYALGLKINF